MNNNNEELKLQIKPRPSQTVSIQIPLDTLEDLQKIATNRNMSIESLIKFYVGKNLREEITKQYSHRLLDSTLKVLAKYIPSEAKRKAMIQEIKSGIE